MVNSCSPRGTAGSAHWHCSRELGCEYVVLRDRRAVRPIAFTIFLTHSRARGPDDGGRRRRDASYGVARDSHPVSTIRRGLRVNHFRYPHARARGADSRSRFHFLVSAARRRRCRGWRRWPPMVPAAELNRGRLRRVLSLRFQAGAIAVFIRWRVAAERRAGFCPSLGLGGCRFLFGEFGWRRRPSYRVSVAAGGLATPR